MDAEKQHIIKMELQALWWQLRQDWFPANPDLDHYRVVWSNRKQKRTMASCCAERKRVIVARELNYPEYHTWLNPLLYHEQCHAFIALTGEPGRNFTLHDKTFRNIERKHPLIAPFNQWAKEGGWEKAVRSDRAKRAWQTRKKAKATTINSKYLSYTSLFRRFFMDS